MRSLNPWFGGTILLGLLLVSSAPTCFIGSAYGNVRLAFDSTSLDFGPVTLPRSRDLTIEVSDTANVQIEIDQFTISGVSAGAFTVLSPTAPLVLSPGSIPTEIIVQFSPQTYGSQTALLSIETSDGTVNITLTGEGIGGGKLVWADSSIDFGALAPGGEHDTIIELYSVGIDTAVVTDLEIAASDTSFDAEFMGGGMPPLVLPPGDSLPISISFRGLPLEGEKDGVLFAIAGVTNTPSCNLLGDVELGSFAILPSPTIDFGVMYAGQILDTTIELVNTGDVDLTFDDLTLAPSGEDFTLINLPSLPFSLGAGDTLPLTIRANPGLTTPHFSQLQIFSQEADINYQTDILRVEVIQASIATPAAQELNYYCAFNTLLTDTIPISNIGSGNVVLTGLASSDSNIVLQSNVSFPDTVLAGMNQQMIVRFSPSSATGDSIQLALMGGMYPIFTDSIALQALPTTAAASIATGAVTEAGADTLEVHTASSLSLFNLDSIIIHISVEDSNIATIDASSIALVPGISNAVISSITPEPGGYAVTITSPDSISASSGSAILSMNLDRFVSSIDSTQVLASIETPEESGCILWSSDSALITGPNVCGSGALQNILSEQPIFSATVRKNPISNESAELSISTHTAEDIQFILTNTLGEILSQGPIHLASGQSAATIPMQNMPSGIYTLHLISETGVCVDLRLVKIE